MPPGEVARIEIDAYPEREFAGEEPHAIKHKSFPVLSPMRARPSEPPAQIVVV